MNWGAGEKFGLKHFVIESDIFHNMSLSSINFIIVCDILYDMSFYIKQYPILKANQDHFHLNSLPHK